MTISIFGFSSSVLAVDEPSYIVVERDKKIEVRQYEPIILAEVVATGDMRKAGNSGFKLLADYIFGNNKPADKIAMTAPVTRTESTKMAMTAPVTRVANKDKTWTVAFVMPEEWTLETLPKPNNPKVSIREIDKRTMATIKFSGRAKEKDYRRKLVELLAWLEINNYEVVGEPQFAGYNSPIMPGPFRRNEVMISVVALQSSQEIN